MSTARNNTILFRVDASRNIGAGHVVRCLTLAVEFRLRGFRPIFVCKAHEDNLIDHILEFGFECHSLPCSTLNTSNFSAGSYSSWLGSTVGEDAALTFEIWRTINPIATVVDHYSLGADWERYFKTDESILVAFDDLANRAHCCDILIDQNLVDNFAIRYKNLVNQKCELLLGPDYAVLQQEYTALDHKFQHRTGPIKNIVVSFGAVDQFDLTGKTIEACLELGRSGVSTDVVVGHMNKNYNSYEKTTRTSDYINIHKNLKSLAPLFRQADLGVGAAGGTCWERLFFGVPSIIAVVAENQLASATELERRGLVRNLGEASSVTKEKIYSALQTCLKIADISTWSKECTSIIDGFGAQRIVNAISQRISKKMVGGY